MKRYLVFTYTQYYPGGGRTDAIGDFDTLDEVKALYHKPYNPAEHWYGLSEDVDVLDMQERRWLDENEYNPTPA